MGKLPELKSIYKPMNINHLKDFGISKLEKSSKTILRVEISTDEKGEAVQQTLLVIRGNKDGPILLLTGGVHGDLVKF